MDAARAAIARGEWQTALQLLDGPKTDADTAEILELRAQAAYGHGDFEASIAAWEELFALLAHKGDHVGAARAAAMTAMYLMMDTGLMAPVRGWLRRAEQHLAGIEGTPAHALIAIVRTYERFMCGDLDGTRVQAALAIELGERTGVEPAVVIGRVAAARVEILDGHMAEGLELLDEIAVLLMTGEVDQLTTGMMYCELICAAQGLALHDRAAEWTEVMERWRHGAAVGGINGRCRVHRAEMLKMKGPCDAAETEALAACEELRPWMRREFGWPLVELGDIRLRRGDLAGAEEAYIAAHDHVWSPHPGLALLRLAQGDVDSATSLIADAIAHPFNIPSKERPPIGALWLAPLLDAQAEIATAAGDGATARQAAEKLQSITQSYPTRSLTACSRLARARAALVSGDVEEAIEASALAGQAWADIGAPYEAARARMVLADAHLANGNADLARMEWRAAREAFDAFGAVQWRDRADALLSAVSPRTSASRTADATFRCDGDTRTITFDGTTVSMRELKGYRYLARLLAEPGREFHVLDLVAVENGSLPTARAQERSTDATPQLGGAGLPMIDEQARNAYRRRLAEVEDDIDEAVRMNDLERIHLAERDREYLLAELARAVGLRGLVRTAGSDAERARVSVARTLRYALDRLAEHHATLALHLERSIHTGTYCRYSPDPLTSLVWHV